MIVPAAEVAGVLAAIQLAPTLAAIAAQGRGTLDDLYPRLGPSGRNPAAPLPPLRRAVTWPHRQAILQQLDLHRLLDAAAGGAVIVLRARIGDTLQDGAVVADLHGGDASDAAVLAGLATGPERTFHQDPLFAFRLLADIGMRALSPAVNDPATVVQVLDAIQSLLVPLVTRELDVAEVADGTAAVKVVLALPSRDDYLRTVLDDLIESGSRSPMVLLQAARNLALTLGERFENVGFLIRDRGSNFTRSFDAVFQANGTEILQTAVQAPRMNATCERLLGTVRRELLDRMLILSEAHLRAVLIEYQAHYNAGRPHQGIAQRVPGYEREAPGVTAVNLDVQRIRRKPVLSGLINEYSRAA